MSLTLRNSLSGLFRYWRTYRDICAALSPSPMATVMASSISERNCFTGCQILSDKFRPASLRFMKASIASVFLSNHPAHRLSKSISLPKQVAASASQILLASSHSRSMSFLIAAYTTECRFLSLSVTFCAIFLLSE